MKKLTKKTMLVLAIAVVLATALTAFAAVTYATPAEAVAALTGKSLDSVIALRQAGKTYGTIAKEAGKLEEFQKAMLEIKKDALAKRVAAGTMTQAQADAIIKAMEQNSATCDATGTNRIGQGMGAGFGCGNGGGMGRGMGGGRGAGGCGGACLAQ